MYNKFEILSQGASYNIAAVHHPILGFFAGQNKQGEVTLYPGNQGVQSVFSAINPLIIPRRINVLLSGHVHMWQQVSFSSPHPTQFVSGFSGTMEDVVPLPAQLPPGATPAQGAVVEHHSSWVKGFGFMTMERKGPNCGKSKCGMSRADKLIPVTSTATIRIANWHRQLEVP